MALMNKRTVLSIALFYSSTSSSRDDWRIPHLRDQYEVGKGITRGGQGGFLKQEIKPKRCSVPYEDEDGIITKRRVP